MRTLRTPAWLLRGISSIPGQLSLQEGMLVFRAMGAGSAWPWQLRKLSALPGAGDFAKTLAETGSAVLFRWPLASLRWRIPWYYFGGGLELAHGGHRLRLGFGPPARAGDIDLESALADVRQVAAMRENGRLWRHALAEAAARR